VWHALLTPPPGATAAAAAASHSKLAFRPWALAAFPAIHSALFPGPLRLVAPAVAAACALGVLGAWGMSCAVAADAGLLRAATAACGQVMGARGVLLLTVAGGWGMPRIEAEGVCHRVPMDYQVVLAHATTGLLTVRLVWFGSGGLVWLGTGLGRGGSGVG